MLAELVTKLDGSMEPIQLDKIHKVVMQSCEGLNDVSESEIEIKAHIQFEDRMKTSDIQDMLIKSAADLISEFNPDYAIAAGRLLIQKIRKQAYGHFKVPPLHSVLAEGVAKKRYTEELAESYSGLEVNYFDSIIDHSKDLDYAYAGVMQMQGKYLVQNRVTGEVYESPQIMNILIAMTLFINEPDKTLRKQLVTDFYNALSSCEISLPTPIMAGVRTRSKQFSSCVLIEAADTLRSIECASTSIIRYVSQKAGIGINAGAIRASGSDIRGGEAEHTGCIPFYRLFQSSVKSCSQGGVRGGAATLFYPLWHREVEQLLVLKNNRGTEDNRLRQLDYAVQCNKFLYTRLVKNEHITLFCPNDVPGLYNSFFEDQDEFERLYVHYENTIPKDKVTVVKASTLFTLWGGERAGTGRIYVQNVDNTNNYGAFDCKAAPIRQSNLCLEIALPTAPMESMDDPNGEIALCTLIAFNLGKLVDDKGVINRNRIQELSHLAIRAIDNLFDYQEYPVLAAELSTLKRRSIGAGVINYSYSLAKQGLSYASPEALKFTHEMFETIQFSLLTSSCKLAEERGPCEKYSDTRYSQGILPIDNYAPAVDTIVDPVYHCDWETLRGSIKQHGVRNSTVSAIMPSETSSQIANATNGIEPPRSLVSTKASKDGLLKQVVPESIKYGLSYDLLWDIKDTQASLRTSAVIQKFTCQTISTNTNYDPKNYPDGKVPMKVILGDMLQAHRFGIKTMYYHQTRDHSKENHLETLVEEDDGCEGGACKI